MNWMRLSDSEAKKRIKDYESKSQDQFSEIVQSWKEGKFELEDGEYSEIRTCICSEYEKYKDKSGYEIDLRVGLAIYKFFLDYKYKLNPIYANDDDIWRFLSVKVFLDITYLREPKNDRFGIYFSHDRVYKHPKRIWLKQLWWYVHLAWQGDVDATYQVLNKFGSGCISQILERAGKGYRVDITRTLFKKMAERCEQDKLPQKTFTAIMMLNYAKGFTVEPTLVNGGTDAYLDGLLDEKLERRISSGVN